MIAFYSGEKRISELIDEELRLLINKFVQCLISEFGEMQEMIVRAQEQGITIYFKGPSQESVTSVDLDVQSRILRIFYDVFKGRKNIKLQVIVEESVTIKGVERIFDFSSLSEGTILAGANPVSGSNEITRGGEHCIILNIGQVYQGEIIPLVACVFKPRDKEISIVTPYEVMEGRITRNYTLDVKSKYSARGKKLLVEIDTTQTMLGGITFEEYLSEQGMLEIHTVVGKIKETDDRGRDKEEPYAHSQICRGDFRLINKKPCHFTWGESRKIFLGAESISSNPEIICEYVPKMFKIMSEYFDVKYRSVGCMSLTVHRAISGDNVITYAQLRPFDYFILKSFFILVSNFFDGKSEMDKDLVPKIPQESRMVWADIGRVFDPSITDYGYKVIIYRRLYEGMVKEKFAFLGPSDFFDKKP